MVSQNIFISFKKFSPFLRVAHQTAVGCGRWRWGVLPSLNPPGLCIQGPHPDQCPQEGERMFHSFLPLLQGLQEEGMDLGSQVEAMRPLFQGNPNHQHKMDQLSAAHQALQRSLEVRGQQRVCVNRGQVPGICPPLLRTFSLFPSVVPSNPSFSFSLSFFLPFLICS